VCMNTNYLCQWLLDILWSSREVQKKWETDTIIAIGHRFVQARYLNEDHRSRAIRLCEDISYNLCRVWGSLDPKTLEMSDLLSELYTSMGHYREAQGVHENILRLVVEGDDGDDRTVDTMASQTALKHVNLLKQSFLRLKGWDKSVATYRDLVDALRQMYKAEPGWKDVYGVETWDFNKEKPSETLGNFVAPKDWEFVKPEDLDEKGELKGRKGLRRSGMNMKRATSNWGIGEVHRVSHGSPSLANGGGENGDVSSKSPVDTHKPAAVESNDGHGSTAKKPVANGVNVKA